MGSATGAEVSLVRCDHPVDTPKKVALAQSLYENENNTIDEICRTLNVSRATLYRYIKTKAAEK